MAEVKSDIDSIFKFAREHMTEVEEEENNEDEGEDLELFCVFCNKCCILHLLPFSV